MASKPLAMQPGEPGWLKELLADHVSFRAMLDELRVKSAACTKVAECQPTLTQLIRKLSVHTSAEEREIHNL
jgi:hemerythrin superfamily protein